MALKFTESFEVTQTSTGKYAQGGFNSTPGRTGNGGTVNGGDAFSKDLDAGNAFTKFYGFAFNLGTTVPGSDMIMFGVGESYSNFALAPYHVCVYMTPTRQLKVVRGTNTATLGTTAALALNTFYYIELKVKCHSTLGEVELRIDTVPVVGPLTNQNTRNGGAGTIQGFHIHFSPGVWIYDDLYICDDQGAVNNTFRGLCSVQTRDALTDAASPGGAGGGMKDWSPFVGATPSSDHGAVVDEASPNGDTDFVSSNTVGHIDTYHMQDITYPGTAVAGVIVSHHARKSDVGPRSINSVCRIGGVNYVSPSPDQALASVYNNSHHGVFEVDPSTGSVWASQAAVNAAEFGPKLVA